MDLEAWSLGESDPDRKRRLVIGYMTGLMIFGAMGMAAAMIKSAPIVQEEEEQVVDVKLATEVPVEIKPAEPPPPPPPAPEMKAAPAPPGPPKKAISVPVAVPTELPTEGNPGDSKGGGNADDDYGSGAPGGAPGGTGTAPAVVAPSPPPPPPPPPPAAPKPQGPIQLPENATPPVALSNAQPSYPADARAQGVEATVVVKYIVSESGDVINATIMRGHPMFDAACLAAVRLWHFKPALLDGKPIAVYRVARFPFKLKM